MDYSSYENTIAKRLAYFSIVGTIAFAVAIICIIWLFRVMRDDKIVFTILLVLSCIVIVGSPILIGVISYTSMYDIKNQAYCVYDGQFRIATDVETRSGTCSLYLEDGTKLETDAYILQSGTYEGRIVYGLKTRIVLDVQTNSLKEPI